MIKLVNRKLAIVLYFVSLLILRFNRSLRDKLVLVRNAILIGNVDQQNIPERLERAIIAIEDKRFYSHKGIDFYSIGRAIIKNTASKRLEGASTIEQQLIRSVTNQREISLKRKLHEALLAILIDKEFTKREVLAGYLWSYDFNSCIGLFELCRQEKYDLEELSWKEAAQIAARLKYPSVNKRNYIKYLKRVRTIEIRLLH